MGKFYGMGNFLQKLQNRVQNFTSKFIWKIFPTIFLFVNEAKFLWIISVVFLRKLDHFSLENSSNFLQKHFLLQFFQKPKKNFVFKFQQFSTKNQTFRNSLREHKQKMNPAIFLRKPRKISTESYSNFSKKHETIFLRKFQNFLRKSKCK